MDQPRRRFSIRISTVAIILLTIGLIGALAFGIWSYLQYNDYKTDFEGKRDLAVTEAVKKQADLDEKKFIEREKEPMRDFVGPEDYGRLTFKYPKTWSVHEAKDVTDGRSDYEAYLHPVKVPPIDRKQKYAIRVGIYNKSTDQVLKLHESNIRDKELKSSSFSNGEFSGTRLDGKLTKTLRGSAILFKLRDKTVLVQTDSKTFLKDFNKLIKTIKFNK